MIYPATYNLTILQNATWKGSFRATQNRQELSGISIAGGEPTFNADCHGLTADDKVIFTGGTAVPCGLTLNTVYYVIAAGLTADAFQVSASIGGSSITVTGTATGTFYVAEPVNLTSYGIDADIRGLIDNDSIATFTPSITTAADGLFELLLPKETALTLAEGRYGWDLSLTTSGGERYYWLTGVATVQRTYSRN